MAEISPLDILLTVMRDRWTTNDPEGAVALAKIAVPYLHGRAAAPRPAADLAGVPDDELNELGGSGTAAADAGPEKPC